jgi:hypothetical protein
MHTKIDVYAKVELDGDVSVANHLEYLIVWHIMIDVRLA